MSIMDLKTLQLIVVTALLCIETCGFVLWMFWSFTLKSWRVNDEIINYGWCKDKNMTIIVNITIQVNPMAHLFSGTIPRMMSSYIHYNNNKDPIFSFADQCWAKSGSRSSLSGEGYDSTTGLLTHNTFFDDSAYRQKRHANANNTSTIEEEPQHRKVFARRNKNRKRKQELEEEEDKNDDREDQYREEKLLNRISIGVALGVNLLLLGGTLNSFSSLYLPWMLFYGVEVVGGWSISLTFLFLPDWFRVTALVTLIRSSFLTWAWVYVVRRHLKEVNDIGQRPKLQTIISIATAHPFSPRPPEEILEIVASTKHQRNRKPSTSRTFESRQHARSFDRGSSFSSNISAEYIQRV